MPTVRTSLYELAEVRAQFNGAADGAVTVAVTAEDSTALSTGSATNTDLPTGVYSYTLTETDTSRVDELSVVFSGVWSGTARTRTVTVDVRGARYFDLDDLRVRADIGDEMAHSNERLETARCDAEDLVRQYLHTDMVGVFRSDLVHGSGTKYMYLPDYARSVRQVTIDGTAIDLAGVDVEAHGVLVRPDLWTKSSTGQANIRRRWIAGYDDQPDERLRAALITYGRWRLLEAKDEGMPAGATRIDTQVGALQIAIATPDRPTGIPQVDAVIMDWRRRLGVVR